jgi:hypothetical protein
MKVFPTYPLLFILFIAFIPAAKGQMKYQYHDKSITIHDNQYDCYNSMEYSICDTAIYIDNYSEHGDMYDSNYTPLIELDTTLSTTQIHALGFFMEHFPYDSLKSDYMSGVTKECDSLRQIYIEINWRGRKKNIGIEDCYQKNIGMLFDMINLLIPTKKSGDLLYNPDMLKFNYSPEKFQCRN